MPSCRAFFLLNRDKNIMIYATFLSVLKWSSWLNWTGSFFTHQSKFCFFFVFFHLVFEWCRKKLVFLPQIFIIDNRQTRKKITTEFNTLATIVQWAGKSFCEVKVSPNFQTSKNNGIPRKLVVFFSLSWIKNWNVMSDDGVVWCRKVIKMIITDVSTGFILRRYFYYINAQG